VVEDAAVLELKHYQADKLELVAAQVKTTAALVVLVVLLVSPKEYAAAAAETVGWADRVTIAGAISHGLLYILVQMDWY
jgi:hypothetical protein